MLFVVDIGLIAFLAMHAYRDGIINPVPDALSTLIRQQPMAWIVSKSHFLGVWRVPSWTQNETCCMISMHLKKGATALHDTHIVILEAQETALFMYCTNNNWVESMITNHINPSLEIF